jgi:hypothetical protein
MDELPSIEDRVSKGIGWLEEQGAYDWAEKIVAAVEASEFELERPCACAVGTALRDWSEVFNEPGDSDDKLLPWGMAVRLGTAPEYDAPNRLMEWAALEAEWERRAREHAAYRAEVLG